MALIKYSRFDDLPFEQFEKMSCSIYVLDFNWNYLFVNRFVHKNLKTSRIFVGKNMWEMFPILAVTPAFQQMKQDIELRKETNITTISPLTGQRLSIIGQALEDCYYFSSSILLDRDSLITDLRNQLHRDLT